MDQITQDEAKRLYESGFWEEWSDESKVRFQLFTDRLCMPFQIFHEALESVLGRPVFTHELAFPEMLRSEYLGNRARPSLEEIVNLIPESKRILLLGGEA